jgi:hypothetical protein
VLVERTYAMAAGRDGNHPNTPVVRQGTIETLKPLRFEVSRTGPETPAAEIICLAGAAIGHLPGH